MFRFAGNNLQEYIGLSVLIGDAPFLRSFDNHRFAPITSVASTPVGINTVTPVALWSWIHIVLLRLATTSAVDDDAGTARERLSNPTFSRIGQCSTLTRKIKALASNVARKCLTPDSRDGFALSRLAHKITVISISEASIFLDDSRQVSCLDGVHEGS